MAQKSIPDDLISVKQLLMANAIMSDALAQLLIEKGVITKEELFTKLKQVQAENKAMKNA